MILDATTLFSENQAITATAISENVTKMVETGVVALSAGQMARNLGPGEDLPMLITATEDFAGLTSLTITIETSDNEDLSSSDVLSTIGPIPVASLVAGWTGPNRMFPDGEIKDYLGLRYTVTGSNATAGQITAALGTEANAG